MKDRSRIDLPIGNIGGRFQDQDYWCSMQSFTNWPHSCNYFQYMLLVRLLVLVLEVNRGLDWRLSWVCSVQVLPAAATCRIKYY